MPSRTAAAFVSRALVAVLALGFLATSAMKFTGMATKNFERWGYPTWFITLIGVCELAGAIGLLIPRTTRLAALGLTLVMLGAVYTHLTNREGPQALVPIVLLALLSVVWWLRRPSPGAAS